MQIICAVSLTVSLPRLAGTRVNEPFVLPLSSISFTHAEKGGRCFPVLYSHRCPCNAVSHTHTHTGTATGSVGKRRGGRRGGHGVAPRAMYEVMARSYASTSSVSSHAAASLRSMFMLALRRRRCFTLALCFRQVRCSRCSFLSLLAVGSARWDGTRRRLPERGGVGGSRVSTARVDCSSRMPLSPRKGVGVSRPHHPPPPAQSFEKPPCHRWHPRRAARPSRRCRHRQLWGAASDTRGCSHTRRWAAGGLTRGREGRPAVSRVELSTRRPASGFIAQNIPLQGMNARVA